MSTPNPDSWQDKRVLLTGGSSLLGSHLADALVDAGAQVRIPSRQSGPPPHLVHAHIEWVMANVADAGVCEKLLDGVDAVFHLAAHRRNIAYHLAHRQEMIDANVRIAQSLSAAVKKHPVPVVFYSSALVSTAPENVDDIADGYLAAKKICESIWGQVSQAANFPLLIIRPVSAYGPYDVFTDDANMIPALIVRAESSKQELTVWGSGTQRRTFVYAPDVAKVTLILLQAEATGVQHVCPPECRTIAQVAETIRDIVNPDLKLHFDPSKPQGPDLCDLPMHISLEAFPWTLLKDGLQKTIDWHKRSL